MTDPAVRLSGLAKRFGDFVAVQSLDLVIPGGAFFSIIGPSGCGKTTTLRMIGGLEAPDRGTIEIAGRDVTRVPAHRRPVNTVFQSYALFPHLDVFENVAFGLREDRRPRAEIRNRVAEMIELVQLLGRERARPGQLSGGQQQRVALARALIKHPAVLLLDEPLGSLDLKLRKEMQGQLKDVQRRVGITFVYVTHDQEEAFSMSDEVAVMNQGVLEQVGAPESVYRRPNTSFVAEFVGSSNRLAGIVDCELDRGSYTVRLAGAEMIEASGPRGLRVGTPVAVIIRPEELDVASGPGVVASQSGFRAIVEDTAYVGSQRHLRLRCETLGMLLATLPGRAQPVQEGDGVNVSWTTDSAWIVPAPSGTAEPQVELAEGVALSAAARR